MAVTMLLSGTPPDVAVLEHALSRTGWDAVTEASTDGYHSVELAVRARPDVIVTDPAMPRLWGRDLIQRLRAVAPSTPIVCWSGSPAPEDAAEMIRAGAAGYLLKEDGPAEVIRSLGAVLDGGSVVSPRIAASLFSRFAEGLHRERELGRSLADATMKVQEVTHAKAEFLANVSHELRTPVTIVKGIAHLLRDQRLSPEDETEFLNKMDVAIDRLTGLVEEILSIADLDRGTVDFSVARTDLSAVVHDLCDRVGRRYPMVHIERDIPATMFAIVDPARISEAIAQLVDNACRYSPSAASVRVRMRAQDEGVVFSVTDAGMGLSREVASLAFQEPFVTGEDVMRKERAGVGLGLHLARRLILLHGGILWADPLPAGGTRVSFCIPTVPPGAGGAGIRVGRVDSSGRIVSVEDGEDVPTVRMVEVTDQGPISGAAAG
ncbi:MAG TPA: ATP-binding protein [Actinomycetota bacterium]|jgi:signal transduction histidine kinase